MRRLTHDVPLRVKIADAEGLVFFEGMETVPQNQPVVEKSDNGGEWYIEHELISPAQGGQWIQIVKSAMAMDEALEILCGLAQTNMILVEDAELLAAPGDYYHSMGRGHDGNQQYWSRQYASETAFRIRNFKTNEVIVGDML